MFSLISPEIFTSFKNAFRFGVPKLSAKTTVSFSFFQKFFKFLRIFSISVMKIVDEYEDMRIVIRFNFYQAPLLTNFWNPVTYINEQPKKIRQNGNSLLACLLAVFEMSTGALILKTTLKNVLWWILLLFLKRALLHKIKFPFINLFMLAKQIINVKLYFYIVQKVSTSTSMIKLYTIVRIEYSDKY